MAAHQAPPSLGFSRQEHWSRLPFPSPKHQSEKWKWSCSVVSDSLQPHGLQPTRLLCPWDFPGKRTGVGWHCLFQVGLHRTVQLQLLQRYWLGHRLGTIGSIVEANGLSCSKAWKWKLKVNSLSRVQLLGTPCTAAHQAPPSMGFSRQEY